MSFEFVTTYLIEGTDTKFWYDQNQEPKKEKHLDRIKRLSEHNEDKIANVPQVLQIRDCHPNYDDNGTYIGWVGIKYVNGVETQIINSSRCVI